MLNALVARFSLLVRLLLGPWDVGPPSKRLYRIARNNYLLLRSKSVSLSVSQSIRLSLLFFPVSGLGCLQS